LIEVAEVTPPPTLLVVTPVEEEVPEYVAPVLAPKPYRN